MTAATLTLTIDGTDYAVSIARGFVRLERQGKRRAAYNVNEHGCTCESWTFGTRRPCKHQQALREVGIVIAPFTAPPALADVDRLDPPDGGGKAKRFTW